MWHIAYVNMRSGGVTHLDACNFNSDYIACIGDAAHQLHKPPHTELSSSNNYVITV